MNMRLVVVAVAVCVNRQIVAAHQALKGWLYDPDCCGGRDCRPIRDDDVSPDPQGWRIRATGEIFPTSDVKHSPDAHFHRCSIDGQETSPTVCLYVPDQS